MKAILPLNRHQCAQIEQSGNPLRRPSSPRLLQRPCGMGPSDKPATEPCSNPAKREKRGTEIHQPEYGGVDFRLGMHGETREKCHENVPRNGANYLIKSHDGTGGTCHGSAHEDGANYLIKEHDIWAWEPSRRPVHRMLLCICPHPVILFPANLARIQGVRLWASGLEPKRGRKEQESHEASKEQESNEALVVYNVTA